MVDAVRDSAEDEINSQLAEGGKPRVGMIENAMERMWHRRSVSANVQHQDPYGPAEGLALCHAVHRLPARVRARGGANMNATTSTGVACSIPRRATVISRSMKSRSTFPNALHNARAVTQ